MVQERALVNQWMDVEAQNYNPPLSALIAEKVFKPMFGGGKPDLAKAEELKAKFSKVLDVYEAHLASNEYLAGSNFSLADLSHLPYTALLWMSGDSDLITSRSNVNKWWERISSRPAWKKISVLQ
ncbi:unnamed protein product [Closterium sp. Yama58-4]|nr:unnamed protein product [Closterium sp. Yama58-4]